MPTEAQLASANPKPKPKGKALGIPKWGWIAAVAIGLIIGYILLRRPSGASAGNAAPDTSGNPSAGVSGAATDSGGGGGAIGVPPNFLDYLKAIGVAGGTSGQTSATATTDSPGNQTPGSFAMVPDPITPGNFVAGDPVTGQPYGGAGDYVQLPGAGGPVAPGSGLAGLILPGAGEAGKAVAPYTGPVGPATTPPLPKGAVPQ